MTLQTKLGIAALTLGSGGVATYAALVPKISGTEISKLITDEFRYVLLDTTEGSVNKNNEAWDEKWKSYYTNNKNNERDVFGLEGWDKDKKLKDELIKKCEELAKTEVPNRADNLYENVTKYCARDVTIKDHAEREGLQLISTEGSTGDSDWTKVANKKAELEADFTNLGITPTDGSYQFATVKKGCTDAIKRNKGEEEYEKIYSSYKKVCVTEAAKEEAEAGVGP